MTLKSISPLHVHAIAALVSGLLHADVKPNPLFTDGAVLQRGQPLPVWGTAREGEKVTVEIANQKASTTAAADGKWRVSLKPLKEGAALTMKITGDNTVIVNDLLVGEVWVCSGQSNMEWPFSRTHNAKEEGPKAAFPKIRMFTVTKKIALTSETEAGGKWIECTPETVGDFSAVGYFFARDLHQKLGVPVGMIHTSWGGTPAQAWMSVEGFGNDPELKGYVDSANQNLVNASAAADPAQNPHRADQNAPTTLYHGMLAPIIPYAIKGGIWYQGEGNADQARQYRTLFPAMIGDWRARWKQGDFPFYFVQIAPYSGQPPEIREAQFLTLSKTKNTAMTVTTDVGNATDIHPTQKEPVGQRLALAARALTYGEKIEYSGPLYDAMIEKGGKIAVRFKHVGGGLVAKDGELKGFTIAGADQKFVPAEAKIRGSSVIVSAESVPAPKAVRYGWANVPDVNLFNQEGLPASPFRTDVD